MKKLSRFIFVVLFLVCFFAYLKPTPAFANHAWGNYHWARSHNPFTVKMGDNVSAQWDAALVRAAYNWDRSSRLNVPIVAGSTSPATCRAKAGQVQVCNSTYGNTGWLGLAQIAINGDHITQGTVKLNDTFFNTPTYNTTAWRNLVMCQEIGHTFGLGHQDENFYNPPLGTCMDYSIDTTPNQQPNMADYYELLDIYRHLDPWNSADIAAVAADDTTLADGSDLNNPSEWGRLVKGIAPTSGTTLAGETTHIAAYEKDLGAGKKLETIVIWAQK